MGSLFFYTSGGNSIRSKWASPVALSNDKIFFEGLGGQWAYKERCQNSVFS